MKACAWCVSPSVVRQGRIFLCAKHYRFQQMRSTAKRKGKAVPSYEELAVITPVDMICAGCLRTMNWRSCDGQSTVASLQHDRNGRKRIICRACNTRHASMRGDTFYSMPANKKICPACKRLKPFGEFFKDRSGRWRNAKTYCKACSTKKMYQWRAERRERGAK